MFHICHHVLTRRSADFGDMFWPKSDVMAFSQAKILGSAGIVVKGTNIAVLGPPLNDYPHSINPAIHDSSIFSRFDVKQQLCCIARREAFSFLSCWDLDVSGSVALRSSAEINSHPSLSSLKFTAALYSEW